MRQKSVQEREAYVAEQIALRTTQPCPEPIAAPSAKRTPRETALENLRLANAARAAKRDPWQQHETNAQRCARYRAKQKKLKQQKKEAGQ